MKKYKIVVIDSKRACKRFGDSYVEEWWGVSSLDGRIDGESPNDIAKMYGLRVQIVKRDRGEILIRFSGPSNNVERAMGDGYFYSVAVGKGKYVK